MGKYPEGKCSDTGMSFCIRTKVLIILILQESFSLSDSFHVLTK